MAGADVANAGSCLAIASSGAGPIGGMGRAFEHADAYRSGVRNPR